MLPPTHTWLCRAGRLLMGSCLFSHSGHFENKMSPNKETCVTAACTILFSKLCCYRMQCKWAFCPDTVGAADFQVSKRNNDTSAETMKLRVEPVSSQQILPPCCSWNYLSMNPSGSALPPPPPCYISFLLLLNYTFCHFHPSFHSSITPPLLPPALSGPQSPELLSDQYSLKFHEDRPSTLVSQ